MSFLVEQRPSDSPFVETVMHGWTVGTGTTTRPAETHWHLVFARHAGGVSPMMVGPLTTAGRVAFQPGVEILWIKFKLGAFMPDLPARDFLNSEASLPGAADRRFWLKGSAWQYPDFENVETFIGRLARADVLVHDPAVAAALQEQTPTVAGRTLRHRFLRATGQSQGHIRQWQRAQRAEALLRQGVTILDTVQAAGYSDQAHLTRSLKQFIGQTPAQIRRQAAAGDADQCERA